MQKAVEIFILFLFILFLYGCENKQEEYKLETRNSQNVAYKFGIHPYLNPIDTFRAYQPIMEYLDAQVEGTDFILEGSNSYAHFEKKLFDGEFTVALPNPYQTILSAKHGYKVIAKMAPDDDFRGIIVSRKDRAIASPKELAGKKISFPAPTALAATMMPLYFLQKNGIDVNKDIEKKFVGSQYSAILNAYTKDSYAAATWPPPWREWKKANPKLASEMVLLWETESLPNNGVVIRKDVDDKIAQKIRDALVTLHKTQKGREILRNAGFERFEAATDTTYLPVFEFIKKYDEAIGLPKDD